MQQNIVDIWTDIYTHSLIMFSKVVDRIDTYLTRRIIYPKNLENVYNLLHGQVPLFSGSVIIAQTI